ncbi:hypothetical protein VTK73DRAFT_9158 [Phialemonium thermophilum]|uniref:Uncharacterized protein n=1 Tax=Phialemonium thermophilum TaxID=223376 RepID=A0ABR3W491_9PEZI
MGSSTTQKASIIDLIGGSESDSKDELDDINIPCSQSSPYFTQPTQLVSRRTISHQTQATQIISRTTLRSSSPPVASSPRSVVEVPASSPFQPKRPSAPPSRLGHLMAPPGTFFRAPTRPSSVGQKRSFDTYSDNDEISDYDNRERANKGPVDTSKNDLNESGGRDDEDEDELSQPVYVVDDSSDDDSPPRGDIQPSFFEQPKRQTNLAVERANEPSKGESVNQAFKERRLNHLVGKVQKMTKKRWPKEDCRKALIKSNFNVSDAVYYLSTMFDSDPVAKKSFTLNSQSSPDFRPAEEALQNPGSGKGRSNMTRAVTPSGPRRGRLIQGRRRPESPSQSPTSSVDPLSLPSQEVIELLSDDEDRGFESDGASSPETGFEERVLNYLNNCNAVQLVAIANIKMDNANVMLQHRPFHSLVDARNVVVAKKGGRRKTNKIALGDDVVDAIENYVRALDGIDHVVGVCEKHGASIAETTSKWILDFTGANKSTDVTEKEGPPTPSSLGSTKRFQELPIGSEPRMMKGHCSLKSYQLYGLNWLYLLYVKNRGGILADDMGLGKTCQVVSLMCAVVEEYERSGRKQNVDPPWPNLVVVPPSTLSNWVSEFKNFAPDIKVVTYSGSQNARDEIAEEILENPAECHVILTTYSQLGRPADIENLMRIEPMIAVFDEGHRLKNPTTRQYKHLIRIPATWRLLLTGTPVQNNLMEMVALLQFIEPKLFKEHFDDLEALFNQKVSLQDVSNGALLYSERVARARSILEPFILQRRKEQVLMQLPPKTRRIVYCDLDETQRAIYKSFERRFRRGKGDAPASAPAQPEGDVPESDHNNVWMQLRKSAIHSQLFRRWFSDDKVAKMARILMREVPQSVLQQPNLDYLTKELQNCSDFELHLWCVDHECIRKFDMPELSFMQSAKIRELLKLVREYRQKGDKVLVFTRFAKVMEILKECFLVEDVQYVALQGSTDVEERQALIDQFQDDADVTAFLLTTGAGGTGINLTAANKVIIFDQSDNPQDDIQAENRAHRLGQTRPVEIIKLISRDTIEELVHRACEKKIELANQVTGWQGGDVQMTSAEMEAAVRTELMSQENNNNIITPPSDD